MSTATAINPRPKGSPIQSVTVDLVQALPEDLKRISGYRQSGAPILKLRVGLIYWIYSYASNRMETNPYILSYETDMEELMGYLQNKAVYVARNPF